jgi:aryl sulfotransferase
MAQWDRVERRVEVLKDELPHRARSLAEFGQMMGRMFTAEDIGLSIQSYRPRPTDIVIAPYGKCGTTWLQQMFHTLRTGGDMDFDDISRVVPWIETARILGLDLEAPQGGKPRGFKSHLSYDRVPKGARYVVSLRDPGDALTSMYRFMEGWLLEPGAVPIAEFCWNWLKRDAEGGGYCRHLVSWWEERDNPNTLLLSYADMITDPAANVKRLARFCGIALDDRLLALTLEQTSLAFMLQYKDRFDDLMMRQLSERLCNLPPGSDSAKVRQGGTGGHRQVLPEEIVTAMDAVWKKIVTPRTGHADFASLDADLQQRLSQS